MYKSIFLFTLCITFAGKDNPTALSTAVPSSYQTIQSSQATQSYQATSEPLKTISSHCACFDKLINAFPCCKSDSSITVTAPHKHSWYKDKRIILASLLLVLVSICIALPIILTHLMNNQNNPNYVSACQLQEKLIFYQDKALFEAQTFGFLNTKEMGVFLVLKLDQWEKIDELAWTNINNNILFPIFKENQKNSNNNLVDKNDINPDIIIEPNNISDANPMIIFNLPNYPAAQVMQDEQGNWQCSLG